MRMMKKLIIFLVLALPALCYGWMNVVQLGGGVASDDYSDIVFWLNFEENDTSDPYTMGSSEYSAGDSTGTYYGTATISSSTPDAPVGTYYLEAVDGYDRMNFDISSGDIVGSTEGRIGLWVYSPLTSTEPVLEVTDGTNKHTLIIETDGTISWNWYDGGNNYYDPSGTISASTWTFIELKYDTVGESRTIYINGVAETSDSDTLDVINANVLSVGQADASTMTNLMDNVMISNDQDRAFYTEGLYDDTVSPR